MDSSTLPFPVPRSLFGQGREILGNCRGIGVGHAACKIAGATAHNTAFSVPSPVNQTACHCGMRLRNKWHCQPPADSLSLHPPPIRCQPAQHQCQEDCHNNCGPIPPAPSEPSIDMAENSAVISESSEVDEDDGIIQSVENIGRTRCVNIDTMLSARPRICRFNFGRPVSHVKRREQRAHPTGRAPHTLPPWQCARAQARNETTQ